MIAAAGRHRGWYCPLMTGPARHRRPFCRAAAWACAVGAAALLALLIVSIFGHLWIARGATHVGIYRGIAFTAWGYNNPTAQILAPADGSAAVHWRANQPGLDWWFRRRFITWTPVRNESLPLWMPIVALGGLGAWLYRRSRVRDAHACGKCGYDLRGLADDAPCPECGRATSRSASS